MNDRWIHEMMDVAVGLLQTTLRNDADVLEIKVEPEFGWTKVTASNDRESVTATRWESFPEIEIKRRTKQQRKPAPQDAGTSTGAVKQ